MGAQINLKIKSDFAQASKDLQKFGTITESQRKKIEAYQKSFKTERVDSFIDANRRLGVGMNANKGITASIIAQQKALERQSISLIKNGINPQDESIEKLNDEYNRLQKEYEDTADASKKTEKAMEDQTAASKVSKGAMLALGASAVLLAGKALEAVKDFTKESINAASAAQEVSAKFGTAFGGIEDRAAETAASLKRDYGLSQVESEKLLGSTGDLLKGFDATASEALAFSDKIQRLSVDVSSYNDLQGGAARASRIVTKAIMGNKDGLTELGVSLLDVDIKQELVRTGQDKLTGQAGKLAKAQATFNLILQQTGDAQGDFARTSDSYANTQKTAAARTADLQVQMGRFLLPTATKAQGIFGDLAGKLGDYLKVLNDIKVAEEAQKSGIATRQQELTILQSKLDLEKSNLKNQKLSMEAKDAELALAGIVISEEKKAESQLGKNIKQRELIIINLERQVGATQVQIEAENNLAEANRKTEEAEINKAKTAEDAANKAIIQKKLDIEMIGKVIDSHQDENEVIDNKILALENITGLTISENEKRLESIQLLQEDKNLIIAEEVAATEEANKKLIDDLLKQSGDKLAILEAEKADAIANAESVGADTTLVHRFYENEKDRITEELRDKKKADRAKDFQEEIDQYKTFTSSIGGIAENLFATQNNFTEREKNNKIEALDDKALSEEEYADEVARIEKEAAIKQWENEKKALVARKVFATAEIVFNTAIGVSKAWAQGGIFGGVGAAIVLGAGIAAGAKVLSEPEPAAPTFQTGTPMGGFEVPDNPKSTRADSSSVRVSPGENVNVTPRGEKQSQRFTIEIGKKVIIDIVNDGITDGDVRITDDNIQKVG